MSSPSEASTSTLSILATPTPSESSGSLSPETVREVPEEGLHAFNLDDIPDDIKKADVSVAADGSFLETSSGAAARELKRWYDQQNGVGKDVRSPFAITAFVNQHGKQMYRLGFRDQGAPAAAAEDFEYRANRQTISTTPRHSTSPQQNRRRSRMSVHSFLPSSVFKNGATGGAAFVAPPPPSVPLLQDGSRSPPARKLRKTRSIPNLVPLRADAPASQPAPSVAPTGRPHAHSVSSADAFRPPSHAPAAVEDRPRCDMFADVMAWGGDLLSPMASSSSLRAQSPSPGAADAPGNFAQPFGPSVGYDSPAWRPASHLAAPQHVLREMQSFDSVLTARADSPRSVRSAIRTRPSEQDVPEEAPSTPLQEAAPLSPKRGAVLAETTLHSRYATDVFDVLQNSRGLPVPDKLSQSALETTIKLSLRTEDSAAPRDDPRFVIWGDVYDGDDDALTPQDSSTDLSSAHSRASRRTGKERSNSTLPDIPPILLPTGGKAARRRMLAATIERWIAQLTSELDYDELLIFFLTYRTYVSAVDLGHLLICRFHWALGEPLNSRDENARRVVRVRTFTAIRYWALTFFNVDFVPDRELRLLFADWLNSLRKDPIMQRHRDALKIVRQLQKIFIDCRDAYLRKGKGVPQRPTTEGNTPVPRPATLGDLSNGHFAESLRRAIEPEDTDIDLDFMPGESSNTPEGLGIVSAAAAGASNPLDLAMMRQPVQLAFQHSKTTPAAHVPSVFPLPPQALAATMHVPRNTVSRVFVSTLGRLGRWRRVLNSRTARTALEPLHTTMDVSAFDIEANETGDLLMVRGGFEQYVKMVESQMQHHIVSPPQPSHVLLPAIPDVEVASTAVSESSSAADPVEPPPQYEESEGRPSISSMSEEAASLRVDDARFSVSSDTTSFRESDSAHTSLASRTQTSNTSLPSSRTNAGSTLFTRGVDVVSIDEMDLSDLSSEEDLHPSAPPGLKKLARRLPNRRDFEFVRQSIDSVSSMGIRTHDSVLSGSSHSSAGAGFAGPIEQWQVDALVDSLSDEEDTGDVEAALRRLEGQINEDKQAAKQSKVDRWVQSIRERRHAGHFDSRRGSHSSDEDYGEAVERSHLQESSQSDSYASSSLPSTSLSSLQSSLDGSSQPAEAVTPEEPAAVLVSDKATIQAPPNPKPQVEDAVPIEILQSRLPRPATPVESPSTVPVAPARPLSRFIHPEKAKWHQSFVRCYRAETLIQHFSMIDRELFMGIKFEELVSPNLTPVNEDANILDWGQFLRQRARLKAEGRHSLLAGSLTVVRGRFNLMANFVVSEIVLTHPSERCVVFGKFVRMAWEAYKLKNYNALVAIIAGLRNEWTMKAMGKTINRLGIREGRVLDDLIAYTTKDKDFKHIREAIELLSDPKAVPTNVQNASIVSTDGQAPTSRSRATSDVKPTPAPACIPFFGVYLSQLYRYSHLPDLIDPTAPEEPVSVDAAQNTFEPPAHPEVFSSLAPLPPSMQLEPLINVHKQRLIASVIQSLVGGQHLASRVQYPLDKRLFQRCLKLRGLDSVTLEHALVLSPPK